MWPSAMARCWLMSASTATTGRPCAARKRLKAAAVVVLPLPPLPTNAMRTAVLPLSFLLETITVVTYE